MVRLVPETNAAEARARLARLLARADRLASTGALPQAEAVCADILTTWPNHPQALHQLSLIALRSGNLDLAIERMRSACRADGVPASYFSNLAEMLRQKGCPQEAEPLARKAIAIDGGFTGAWNNLGIILQETGQLTESQECFERVLRAEPDNAQAHNNIGNTVRLLGLLDKAEAHWKRALALDPRYTTPANNLASLYTDQGRYENAVHYGQIAVRGQPPIVDAYLNLAAAETARSNDLAALRVLDDAAARWPRDPRVLSQRALALKQIDRLDEALDCVGRALAIAPEHAESRFVYATVLRACERDGEALAAFDQTIDLRGATQEKAMLNRGRLLGEIGRADEALRSFDQVLEAFPESASAYLYRADYIKFETGDPSIAAMQSLLKTAVGQSYTNRIAIHFALGKAFLDLGDSDAAFRHLNEGNRLKRSTIAYDAQATSDWMASLAAATSRETLAGAREGGCRSSLPIFVVGMPRSGTTLIEQILASHADIFGAGELKFMNRIAEQNGGVPQVFSHATPQRLADMGHRYIGELLKPGRRERHIVDKMPSNFLYVGLIGMILPNAKIIHVTRDPVDTCLSCYSKIFGGEQAFAYDLAELGRFYGDYRKLMDHWRKVIPPKNLLEVRYEDVVSDIEGEARRMVDFIGLPWDAACLDFHRTDRAIRTASVNQVRRQVYRTSIDRWRIHAANLKPLLAELGMGQDIGGR